MQKAQNDKTWTDQKTFLFETFRSTIFGIVALITALTISNRFQEIADQRKIEYSTQVQQRADFVENYFMTSSEASIALIKSIESEELTDDLKREVGRSYIETVGKLRALYIITPLYFSQKVEEAVSEHSKIVIEKFEKAEKCFDLQIENWKKCKSSLGMNKINRSEFKLAQLMREEIHQNVDLRQ